MGIPHILAIVAKTRATVAGVEIVYRRDGREVPLRATPGRTVYDEISDEASVLRRQTRDYLLPTAALNIDGLPFLPQRGDLIEERVGCETLTYEVIAVDGEHAFRYTDPYRAELRIHTQQVT